jgi:2-polyprenyl-3-methyl-5-hydroxy-6-metoxy-1,4-benzoquinol methylase
VTLRERLPAPLVRALEPLAKQRAMRRYRTGPLRTRYPASAAELRSSELMRARWYYSVELLEGVVTEGQFPTAAPMLPRLLLRRCAVEGRSCLDLGTMEGLVPALLTKRGARALAVDHSNHSLAKLDAVRRYHQVDFEFRTVGLMYRLHEQLRPGGFDLLNCSGLLYHVFSPLSVLASVRPLAKRGGIVIVSTNVLLARDPVLEFNVAGALQRDPNTFWYTTPTLLDYLLRYLRLEPIDCIYSAHEEYGAQYALDRPSGYLSVACRAVQDARGDPWMASAQRSWEYLGLSDWSLADAQPETDIAYDAPSGGQPIDLMETIERQAPVSSPVSERDSHLLRLSARS